MTLNPHASNLIDITVKAFNGDVASISQTDGLSLVENWLGFLQSNNKDNNSLVDALSALKRELQSDNPDGPSIQQILQALIGQTKQTSDSADRENQPKLNTLADALQAFSQRATGKIKRDTTADQAPMTSTVGASSLNSDTVSNRNEGTVSSGTTVDTTENNGGSTEERFPKEPGDTGSKQGNDETGSSTSDSSRSDTGRVDGMGISGGIGDTDYSQSGGRSQY